MAKVIKISEQQEKLIYQLLKEDIETSAFSFDDLRSLKSLKARMTYCLNKLGKTIGRGSSRAVFNLGDGIVLKLAMNRKGLAQNEYEYESGNEYTNRIIPQVYNDASDNVSYKWIVCEYATPFKKEKDFETIVGISWDDFILWLRRMDYQRKDPYHQKQLARLPMMDNDMAWELADANHNLEELTTYISTYGHQGLNDFYQLQNWGYVQRDGKDTLVLLDCGLSNNIAKTYYGFQMENIKIHKGNKGKNKSMQSRWGDSIDCPHCSDGQKAFFSMSISDGGKGRGRIKVTDENGIEQDSEVQTIALYYCPKCHKFIAQNNMA